MKGAELIVDFLVRKRMRYAFGLCGHGILGFLDAALDRTELQVVSVHHEASAGFMADAYFRVSHQPAATFTSCGPGSANLPVAAASAFMDSSAFMAITGDVPTSQWNRGPFQETGKYFQGDFVNVMRPYVKRSFQPTRPDMLPLALRLAYGSMVSGRPGPVHVDVPLNVFVEEVDDATADTAWDEDVALPRSGAEPQAVTRALQLLRGAERPVIVAGHGVEISEAEAELAELAEHLDLPIATTPLAKPVVDMRWSRCLGPTGRNGTYPANAATRNADVVLAIGSRFDDRATSSWLPGFTYSIPPTKLIQVDIDPAELGRNYPISVALLGDARTVLRQMLAALKERSSDPPSRDDWWRRIALWRERWERHMVSGRSAGSVPIKPQRLIREIRSVLDDDAIIVSDVGVHHNWLISELETRSPRSFLHSWGFAAMGFGVAGVLGAKLAAPDRTVLGICGDGGFLMMPSVVATAVEFGIPAVWLVWNNYGYCSIRDQQMGYFGKERELATSFELKKTGELISPDYAAMARSMGAKAATVESPGDIGDHLQCALDSGEPYLLDVRVDRDDRPPATASWDLPPLPNPLPDFGWGEDG